MIKTLLYGSLLSVSLWGEMRPTLATGNHAQAVQQCQALSTSTTQYRLPTVGELFTYALSRPQAPARIAWSDTPLAGSQRLYFAVAIATLDTNTYPQTERMDVLCTSDPYPTPKANRFIAKEGVVIDTATNQLWEVKTAQNKKIRYTFADAKTYCENLSLSNQTGWRLPTVQELYTIIDHTRVSPSLDTTLFGETIFKYYWTNDNSYDDFANEAFVIGFKIGSVASGSKNNESFVRCVKSLEH